MFNKNKFKEAESFNIHDLLIQGLFGLLICLAMFFLAPGGGLPGKLIRGPIVIILNILPIVLTGIFFQGLLGRRRPALILNSILYIVIFLVHRTKVFYRNFPLKISDFKLAVEALNMTSNSYYPDLKGSLASIFGIVCLIILAFLFKSKKIKVRDRLISVLVVLISSAILLLFVYSKDVIYNNIPMEGNIYNSIDQFNAKGFNYSFLHKIKDSFIRPPEGYDDKEIRERDVLDHSESIADIKNMERPNIIWIMGEAFTDLSQDPQFNFEKGDDPNENFKILQEKSVLHGRIVVPAYIGGTGDTEFDVLTGAMTINCAPDNNYAFNAIKRDVGSLPNLLKSIGYKTMGFHPGFAWFYGRQDVYPKLGLDDNMFVEDIKDPLIKGGYLDEKQFTEIYKENFLKAVNESEDPVFSYAVDIQNHGPYDFGKYGEVLPFSCDSQLSEEVKNSIGSYFLGVKAMDLMLGDIYEMMEGLDEPTIMVFYGDHLPGLGTNQSGFDEIGKHLTNENLEKEIEYYSTPYIVVANDKGKALMDRQKVEVEDGQPVSANYLSSMVLDMLDYNKVDNFFIYNSELRKRLPIISRNFIYDGSEAYPRSEVKGNAKAYYDDYRRYQYYRINK